VAPALEKGAIAAVVQSLDKIDKKFHARCFVFENIRKALALASHTFFGKPTERLLLLGITGTKGKTSASFLLESICTAAGHKVALAGTVACRYPGFNNYSERTTLESYDLQKFLREAIDKGQATAAVLEISSHALSLDRVAGCAFDGVLFTNLSEDHLDFYSDMENYFQAKRLLFTQGAQKKQGREPVGATNIDDAFGKRLLQEKNLAVVSYGKEQGDFSGEDLTVDASGVHGTISYKQSEKIKIASPLMGTFSLHNILGVVALARALHFKTTEIEQGISNLSGVPGRLERIPTSRSFHVFVDSAHHEASLENVLSSLRPLCKGRLIVVFGAGGDRPPARRQMGRAAARLADFSVITSDNPRSEDPKKIIADVEEHFKAALAADPSLTSTFVSKVDRQAAIRTALSAARADDIVCIAGKGHETGQIIGTQTLPFDDREEVKKVLRELEK